MGRQTRRQFLCVLGVGGVAGLAGCSGGGSGDGSTETTQGTPEQGVENGQQESGTTNWSTFRYDNRNTGYNPNTTGPAEEPDSLWEKAGFGEAYPAIVDGIVYVGGKSSVRALDAETGEEEWSYDVGSTVDATPAVVDGTVVFPSWGGELYALSAEDGSEEWVRSESTVTGGSLGGKFAALETGAVTVADGIVYDALEARRKDSFYAFDLESGETEFLIDSNPSDDELEWESRREYFSSAPAIADGTAYLGSETGWHYAIDTSSGGIRWSTSVDTGFRGSSTVVDGTVYFAETGRKPGQEDPKLHAADAATGEIQWTYDVGPEDSGQEVRAATTFAHGAVLVGHSGGQLHAVEPDGTERWTIDVNGGVFSAPSAGAERLYLGVFGGSAYALDPETGDVIWRVDRLGRDIDTPPIPYEDTVYVNAESGPLTALRA